jgi:hypothetical protein
MPFRTREGWMCSRVDKGLKKIVFKGVKRPDGRDVRAEERRWCP